MQPHDDSTEPRSPFRDATPELIPAEDDSGGPGCIVWGLVGLLTVFLGGMVIILAIISGFNSGLTIAKSNATATQNAEIQVQCELLGNDLRDGGNLSLAQRRIEVLLEQTPAVACLNTYIPTATTIFLQSLPTATATPTVTLSPTMTHTPTIAPTDAPTTEAVVDTDSPFDLEDLFSDAQSAIAVGEFVDAIDTLDAIIAIDPDYRATEVSQMIFNALTSHATNLYRTGSLAEAIVYTGRAEQYGDIGGLNYERFIASLYLDAQRYTGRNYPQAISLLRRIVYEQNLPNYNGDSVRLLQEQYFAYADALVIQMDYCNAFQQYDLGLQVNANSGLVASARANRDQAEINCQNAPATPDPNAPTIDPANAPPPTATFAPVGQPGG